MKSLEGVGKSTLWEFIMKYVLGYQICIKSNADPLRTSNNKILCGMLFVLFEELPTFTQNEWSAVSSRLKDMATSDRIIYSDKYEKGYEAQNQNNYVINTNVDALKSAEGRRIWIPTISTKRIKDYAYFKQIRDKCFNNQVGEAFYSYMLEINTDGWNAQAEMPMTTSKLNTIASRLDSVYLFLKDCYILHRKSIKAKTSTFYAEFKNYCQMYGRKVIGKHEFYNKLTEININYKKTDGCHKYVIDYITLQEIADKFKWIHETDEYTTEHDLNDLEYGVESIDKKQTLYEFEDLRYNQNYMQALKIFNKI